VTVDRAFCDHCLQKIAGHANNKHNPLLVALLGGMLWRNASADAYYVHTRLILAGRIVWVDGGPSCADQALQEHEPKAFGPLR
jgi:hypothetical protein